MSAAARAEARRKAILARGSDRLAKLTTSSRGDDPAYAHDDPPLPSLSTGLKTFVGEESDMPTPPSRPSPSPQPRRTQARAASDSHTPLAAAGFGNGSPPDPSVWSLEQQQQLMAALMGGGFPSTTGAPPPFSLPGLQDSGSGAPIDDNPLAAMMTAFAQPQTPFAPGQVQETHVAPTRLQKLLPFAHLITVWSLLGYFVLWKEPQIFQERSSFVGKDVSLWARWAELATRNPGSSPIDGFGWAVQIVPFFWAFTTIQIVLHSLRIFAGFDAVKPPMLLALALPHLPQPLPTIIINGLKYLQMGRAFLDDLAGLIVGIGFIVWIAGWLSGSGL